MIRDISVTALLACCLFLAGCGGVSQSGSGSGPSGRLAFVNGSQTVIAGACSAAVQLQSQDSSGNPSAVASDLNLSLTSTSATGGFVTYYSDAGCTQRVKTAVIPASNSTSTSLYFLRNVASASPLTIKASDATGQYSTASQSMTVSRNLAFTSAWDSPNLPSGFSTGVINVKTYCKLPINQFAGAICAAGDGVTDDTQAIQQAIHLNAGASSVRASNPSSSRDSIIYFPTGTYLISQPILWKDGNGGWVAYLSFQGENNSDTILKFADGAPGSKQDQNCWQSGLTNSVLYTASNESMDGAPNGAEGGEGDQAFRNNIRNLTVDIGQNNPNLVGIDYAGSNDTVIENVNIVSGDGQGCVGLNEYRYSAGPELFSNLFIQGFSTGIQGAGEADLCAGTSGNIRVTNLEHIRIQDQTTAGINLPGAAQANIRDLKSDNTVVAVAANNPAGIYTNVLTIVDSSLTGGSSSSAITLQQGFGAASLPYTFIRNIAFSGYAALSNGVLQSTSTNEFTSQTALFGSEHSSKGSLNLTVSETPVFSDDTKDGTDFSSWTFPVIPSGCAINSQQEPCDLTSALQSAINAASSTVVIPWGYYGLSSPLLVGGGHGMNVKRILCLGCHLVAMASPTCPEIGNTAQYPNGCNNQEALTIGDTNHSTLWIEGLSPQYETGLPGDDPFHFGYSLGTPVTPVLLNTTNTTTLVLREVDNITYLDQPKQASGPFSPVYLESVAFGPFTFVNRQVWARNLDSEVAPESAKFMACVTGSATTTNPRCGTGTVTTNRPLDFLQQGNSHATITQTSSNNGASLWTLGFKTENREEPAVCQYDQSGGGMHDGAALPANSLLEVEDGAKAEILGLGSFDHRLNSTDTNGKPIGAIVSNPATSAASPISVEGYLSGGHSDQEYLISVQQLYPDGTQSLIYQFDYCATHSNAFCSYSNGSGADTAPASAFPIYVGH